MKDRTEAVKILSIFFRVATFVLAGLTLSFEVDGNGVLWIMWRDATCLAATLLAIALLMAVGWWYTARIVGGARQQNEVNRFVRRRSTAAGGQEAYNIWRAMKTPRRLVLALAVFLLFGTIGPLSVLMAGHLYPITWQRILIVTVASGGMSASVILFGNRLLLLAFFFLLFMSGSVFSNRIESILTGRAVAEEALPHMGVITLDAAKYSDVRDQRELIGTIAVVLLVSGYVLFIRMLTKEGAQRARFETEVTIAQNIQESLLPAETFRTALCEIAGCTVPASAVGGDYFDIHELPDGRVVVVVADVSGHGIGAGILSAMTKSALHSQLEHDASPVAVLNNLNKTLFHVTEKNMFVTFGYLLIDGKAGLLRLSTAGHPPLLVRAGDGTVTELRTPNLGLGLTPDASFTEAVVPFSPGQSVCMYTDGVTEAMNAGDEQFGLARLKALISESGCRPADEFSTKALAAIRRFAGSKQLADDVTLVCVNLS